MKSTSILVAVVLLLSASACSSDTSTKAKGDGGKEQTGAGGAGAGGAASEGGAQGDTCATSGLNSAPLSCLQNWTAAEAIYTSSCPLPTGGYRARCAPYDTIVYTKANEQDWCFYDDGTGNLIGAKSIVHGTTTCSSFDFSFAAPDVASCAPLGPSCTGDAAP